MASVRSPQQSGSHKCKPSAGMNPTSHFIYLWAVPRLVSPCLPPIYLRFARSPPEASRQDLCLPRRVPADCTGGERGPFEGTAGTPQLRPPVPGGAAVARGVTRPAATRLPASTQRRGGRRRGGALPPDPCARGRKQAAPVRDMQTPATALPGAGVPLSPVRAGRSRGLGGRPGEAPTCGRPRFCPERMADAELPPPLCRRGAVPCPLPPPGALLSCRCHTAPSHRGMPLPTAAAAREKTRLLRTRERKGS